MSVIKVTYEFRLEDEQKKIMEYLGIHKEIIFAINTELTFESKDSSNQFTFIKLAKLQNEKIVDSKLSEYEKGKIGRNYFLTDLGFKLLEQLIF